MVAREDLWGFINRSKGELALHSHLLAYLATGSTRVASMLRHRVLLPGPRAHSAAVWVLFRESSPKISLACSPGTSIVLDFI